MHVAVNADTTDNTVADAGIFPKWIAKLADFLVLKTDGAMTPIQTVFIGNTVVMLVKRYRRPVLAVFHVSSVAQASHLVTV